LETTVSNLEAMDKSSIAFDFGQSPENPSSSYSSNFEPLNTFLGDSNSAPITQQIKDNGTVNTNMTLANQLKQKLEQQKHIPLPPLQSLVSPLQPLVPALENPSPSTIVNLPPKKFINHHLSHVLPRHLFCHSANKK